MKTNKKPFVKKRRSPIPQALIIASAVALFVYYKTSNLTYGYCSFILVISAQIIFAVARKFSSRARLLSASEATIYNMDGVEFENCCIEHFRKLGYQASPTATSGDYGADIVLKKGGIKTVVQCKRYKGKVGVAAVQEVIGAKGYYKADNAMVVTNSYFTPNAVELAKANNVELWDRNKLVKAFKIQ